MAALRNVSVQYFARLREQAGLAVERCTTAAPTPRALYEELRERHGFRPSSAELKVAVNDEFSRWDRPLAEGDTIVFIPPVAGG